MTPSTPSTPSTGTPVSDQDDPDAHKGAVEGDRPTDDQQFNQHGGGLDDAGLPDDPVAICEDVLGADADKTQG